MAYSETRIVIGGLAHVPILIFIVNFVKGKFESIAAKVVEVKKEEVKKEEVKESAVKEEVKAEEVKESAVKEESE